MPSFGQRQKFARSRFGAFKRTLAREPLADEILHVAVGQFSIACVGMFGEIAGGNDAELP
jgi:hypothetical protein